MVVKGKTKSGIKFELDSRIRDDARLMFLMAKAQKTDDPMEMSTAMMDLLSLFFGSEDNVMIFMNAVAEKHKGVCDVKNMIAEINDMFEALNAKNS